MRQTKILFAMSNKKNIFHFVLIFFQMIRIFFLFLFMFSCNSSEDLSQKNEENLFPQMVIINELKQELEKSDKIKKYQSRFEYEIDNLSRVKKLDIARAEPYLHIDFGKNILKLKDLEYLKLINVTLDANLSLKKLPKLIQVQMKNIYVSIPNVCVYLENNFLTALDISFDNAGDEINSHSKVGSMSFVGDAKNLKRMKIIAPTMESFNLPQKSFQNLEEIEIHGNLKKLDLTNLPNLKIAKIRSSYFSDPDSLKINTKFIKYISIYGLKPYKNEKLFRNRFGNKIYIHR